MGVGAATPYTAVDESAGNTTMMVAVGKLAQGATPPLRTIHKAGMVGSKIVPGDTDPGTETRARYKQEDETEEQRQRGASSSAPRRPTSDQVPRALGERSASAWGRTEPAQFSQQNCWTWGRCGSMWGHLDHKP